MSKPVQPTQPAQTDSSKRIWTIFGVATVATAALYHFLSQEEKEDSQQKEGEEENNPAIIAENAFESEANNTELASLWVLISKIPYMSKPPSRKPSIDLNGSLEYSLPISPSSNLNRPTYAEIGAPCEDYLKLLLHPQVEATAAAVIKVPLAQWCVVVITHNISVMVSHILYVVVFLNKRINLKQQKQGKQLANTSFGHANFVVSSC
ncbi:hypothetical protein RFI_16701 [Reticulomyxa filosa]|uniref:Uncharacterized protein n=1 Tax=Reticulomyxa filosa TaxID=46433 RepID=X6N443_RETFI|nr:hypothetical protein RFI_16701 [Reticulomyxa filosa]|eukprot:ETO20514.1 hypothetical protein RFI_16701 [Reticulomyxa filosa]